MSDPPSEARRIVIRGVVQGVGFRPFVYRMARDWNINGWVLNGEAGVLVQAEGRPSDLERFVRALRDEAPPASVIADLLVEPAETEGFDRFEIRSSERTAAPTVRISPDLTMCEDCRRELRDPADQRYRYEYINCTNCGPRYSIINQLPYDRHNTTMAPWPLCATCRRQYEDPLDRRFHAQPVACAACGPRYELFERGVAQAHGAEAIERTARMLQDGQILAIKGIGGFHLACDASQPEVVEALRSRKFRKEKPFAVMVKTVDDARGLVELEAEAEELLSSVARPIVVAIAKAPWPGIAPDNPTIGVMLPYAPLHALLFEAGAPSPLVLTSANRSSEPIAYRDDEALERLEGIADAFLIGQRPIARRVDDSVITVRRGRPFMIRRSRGYAPGAVAVLRSDRPILALGADLKNAIALVVKGTIFVSQHIGDLGDYETDLAFNETIDDLLTMYEVDRSELIIAHDLHPQYVSSRRAESLESCRRAGVQHHHAHIASVLAEHGLLEERVIGVSFDGTGYGEDDTIWGSEFLVGSLAEGFVRAASLPPVPMPGGDAAARHPAQAAAAFLTGVPDLPDLRQPPFQFPRRFFDAAELIERNVRCFTSTSAGRLFDAAAALLGFTREISFEGQAAIWLEHLARRSPMVEGYPFDGLDPRPALGRMIEERAAGRPEPELAAAFHAGMANAIVAEVVRLAESSGVRIVALSGGVWQNELLLKLVADAIASRTSLEVRTNAMVPVNDGGISLGQAAIASRMTLQ